MLLKHSIMLLTMIISTSFFVTVQAEEKPVPGQRIGFQKTELDAKFRSEGVAVGDLNNDGRKDIIAGMVWYEAPDWKMHSMVDQLPEYDPKGYSNSFCTFAQDLNDDGWMDVIVVDFPGTPTWWFENPGEASGSWSRHVLTPVTNNESPQLADVTGDGKPELVAGYSPDPKQPDGPQRRMAYMTAGPDPYQPWEIHVVSEPAAPGTQRYSHGLGIGDINGDGRNDILCAEGWWEAPQDISTTPWPFHAAPFGKLAAQMPVYDFDDDGDNDVLSSSPHAYGIWWHEQLEDGQWKTHGIDDTFSQTHAICLVDINQDSLPDFVTGKRWWAHGGKDPGGNEPAVFKWYELQRDGGTVRWIAHQFDHDSGIGTQFEVADVNEDGLLDIVSSNKKGVFYFEQKRD